MFLSLHMTSLRFFPVDEEVHFETVLNSGGHLNFQLIELFGVLNRSSVCSFQTAIVHGDQGIEGK